MNASSQELQAIGSPFIEPRWGNLYGPSLQSSISRELAPTVGPYQPSQALAASHAIEQQIPELASARESLLNEVRKRYVLQPESPEATFLVEHHALPQLLLAAEASLREAFGSDTIFVLRTPIDESGARTLYAVAVWPGEAAAARTALQQFDDAWWLANARRSAGRLTFTYELV